MYHTPTLDEKCPKEAHKLDLQISPTERNINMYGIYSTNKQKLVRLEKRTYECGSFLFEKVI